MTTKEEIRIQELEGKNNPFLVPEGYFENFNERLFDRLPQTQKAKTVRLMPRLLRYAAAVVVVLGVGSALYWNHSQSAFLASNEVTQEEYYNDALDYIMVDNMEIAEYLTEAE